MDNLSLAAALASALLHAGWNAAIKASARPAEAMTAQMVGAALLALAGLLVFGPPPRSAWPWVALSTLLNMVAVTALLRAYRLGDFGTVYPTMRATSVLCVALLAMLLFGERLSLPGWGGVLLVIAGLAFLAWDARQASAASRHAGALAVTMLAGLVTAGYVLADARGVRASGSALSYGCAVSVTNAIGMAWLHRAAGSPWRLLRTQWRVAAPAALASTVSYLLILWVLQHTPVALAAALRDTSALFALLIAAVWLKEPLRPLRLAALLVALAGVPLLRLG